MENKPDIRRKAASTPEEKRQALERILGFAKSVFQPEIPPETIKQRLEKLGVSYNVWDDGRTMSIHYKDLLAAEAKVRKDWEEEVHRRTGRKPLGGEIQAT